MTGPGHAVTQTRISFKFVLSTLRHPSLPRHPVGLYMVNLPVTVYSLRSRIFFRRPPVAVRVKRDEGG